MSHVRQTERTKILHHNHYDITKYSKYHVINYVNPNVYHLVEPEKFKGLVVINDSLMNTIETIVKDTVDKIMPKDKKGQPRIGPRIDYEKIQLLDANGFPCCYYTSYYKKVLPYLDKLGNQKTILFLSLHPMEILEGDIPNIDDGGHNNLDIHLNLTMGKITNIRIYGPM